MNQKFKTKRKLLLQIQQDELQVAAITYKLKDKISTSHVSQLLYILGLRRKSALKRNVIYLAMGSPRRSRRPRPQNVGQIAGPSLGIPKTTFNEELIDMYQHDGPTGFPGFQPSQAWA
jgi:hypothetical protein